jgi:type II secretory pathway pseudopilin PulG
MKQSRGFTLLELIGIMTIAAIIATAILPHALSKVRYQKGEEEKVMMAQISQTFLHALQLEGFVPDTAAGANGWNTFISSYMGKNANAILRNVRGYERKMIVQEGFFAQLPWQPSVLFSSAPVFPWGLPTSNPLQARIMLISALENPVASTQLTNQQFQNIWEQNAQTPAMFIESDALIIERISLSQAMIPLTFQINSTANSPAWSLQPSGIWRNIAQGNYRVFVFKGTTIQLRNNTATLTIPMHNPRNISYNGEWEL